MPTGTKVKTITIASVIDVVGGLSMDSLEGQIYLMDTNQADGSSSQGTDHLSTAAKKGDRLIWTIASLECEAYAAISDIVIDKNYCEPEEKFYEGTDVSYWTAIIKKDITADVPYSVKLKLGTRDEHLATTSLLTICKPSHT